MLNVISIIQCIDPSEKAMDQKAQEHLPALSGTDQLIPATDFL